MAPYARFPSLGPILARALHGRAGGLAGRGWRGLLVDALVGEEASTRSYSVLILRVRIGVRRDS